MYLGIEIGGTKLQLGLGLGDGTIRSVWRGTVDVSSGGEGIRQQILQAVPELLSSAQVDRSNLKGVGIGFGGPVDDNTQRVIKSHQISGWDDFPLASWLGQSLQLPAVLGNDADVAGLAETLFGAGKNQSPIFYMTVGSGIGGGFILDGTIYRAVGRGAAEIGHIRVEHGTQVLEQVASGWSIQNQARQATGLTHLTVPDVGRLAQEGNAICQQILQRAIHALAEAICHGIVLLCPRMLVIGGGVSLLGESLFFQPLREAVVQRVFPPFAGLTQIVPAELGELVVVYGALTLANQSIS